MAEQESVFDEDQEYDTVTLTLEDDTELECVILEIYPAGEHEYIALMPIDENGDFLDDEGPLIYRYVDHGDDADPELENIDDDDELEIACDAFDELLDAAEFDEEDADGEEE